MGGVKSRTRFEIQAVFGGSHVMKVTSRKDRSLTLEELVSSLKKYTAKIEEMMLASRDIPPESLK